MIRIHPIQTGTVHVKKRQVEGSGWGALRPIRTMLASEWYDEMPIYAWAIEHPEGIFVVDTGENARAAEKGYYPDWHLYYRGSMVVKVRPDQELGPSLARLGIKPGDVRKVILTHLHTDHTGGLGHLPDCEVLVSRAEFRTAHTLWGRIKGYLPHRFPKTFRPKLIDFDPEPVGAFDRSLRVTKDGAITLVPTPGHTPGHLSVIVQGPDVDWFIAGDTSNEQRMLVDNVADGLSQAPAAILKTFEKIRAFARSRPTVYLPSHDCQCEQRLRERQTIYPLVPEPAKP